MRGRRKKLKKLHNRFVILFSGRSDCDCFSSSDHGCLQHSISLSAVCSRAYVLTVKSSIWWILVVMQIEDLGGSALVCGGDMSKEADVEALFKAVGVFLSILPSIDVCRISHICLSEFLWTKLAHAVCSLQALDKWGTVDILVNNAGTYSYKVFAPFHHQDARAVAETFLS